MKAIFLNKTVTNQRPAVSLSLNIRVSEILWKACMITIPGNLERQYVVFLRVKTIPIAENGYCHKWLRSYLDFVLIPPFDDEREHMVRSVRGTDPTHCRALPKCAEQTYSILPQTHRALNPLFYR
jgi:hypothetical protein